MVARGQFCAGPRRICGVKNTEAWYSLSTSPFLCPCHCTDAPCLFIHLSPTVLILTWNRERWCTAVRNNEVIIDNHVVMFSLSHLDTMVKVKCTLVQILRLCTVRTAHRGVRSITSPVHDHGTRRGWGVSVMPRPLFPPGKIRYPLYKRLGGPQGRSGLVRKISPPPGFDPRTVQSVASRYTDYATRPTFRHYSSPK